MSKAFSENEKAFIVEKLRAGAMDCMQRYGIRKASVDELVRMAGISKGAFYTFYPSKEILFFEVITMAQEKIQNGLIRKIQDLPGELNESVVSAILFDLFKGITQSFLVSVMRNGDLEYLERKLSAEVMAAHQLDDDAVFKQFCQLLPDVDAKKAGLFSAALRAIALTMLHKQSVGNDVYEDVLKILITGVVSQLFHKNN